MLGPCRTTTTPNFRDSPRLTIFMSHASRCLSLDVDQVVLLVTPLMPRNQSNRILMTIVNVLDLILGRSPLKQVCRHLNLLV